MVRLSAATPDLPGFILRRLAFGALTLVIISVLVFAGIELLPGDLAQAILGPSATPENLAALRAQLGLNQPAPERYIRWITGMLHGDFGVSLATGRSVAELLGERLSNTVFLAAAAACISIPLGLAGGLLAALYRRKAPDRFLSLFALVIISLPEFFLGYLLIALFAVTWSLFPAVSLASPDLSFAGRLQDIALPAITLGLGVAAYVMRMTRAAVINVLAAPYIEMAHLKGLRPSRIILRHALPNALAPIINVVVLNLAYLVVGVVVVEVVFAYPGLGQLLVDAVSKRDLPLVQAASLIFAATYVVLNLAADLLTIAANPRLRRRR